MRSGPPPASSKINISSIFPKKIFLNLTYCRYYPGDRLNDETEKEAYMYSVSQSSEFSRNTTLVISEGGKVGRGHTEEMW